MGTPPEIAIVTVQGGDVPVLFHSKRNVLWTTRLYVRILRDMKGMARQTLAVVQQCLEADRFEVTFHFRGRMRERGLFWEDVLHALDNAGNVSNDGFDMVGHSKWIVQGPAANGGMIEIVCAVKPDETGVRFITIYWE